MQTIKDEIEILKNKHKQISNYYKRISVMLKELNSKIASFLLYPSQNVCEIMDYVRNYNLQTNELYKNITELTDNESVEKYLHRRNFEKMLVKFNLESVVKNLTDKDLTKKRLHTTHIIMDKTEYENGKNCDYFGTVEFSAYCSEKVDENKFYTVSEINNLINDNQLVMYFPLHYDRDNNMKHETYALNTNEILKNLDKINFPREYEDKINFIHENELSKINSQIDKNINLFVIIYYIEDFFAHSSSDLKQDLKQKIDYASKCYLGLESVLCANIVYEIANTLKYVKQKLENNKNNYKQSVKDLLVNQRNIDSFSKE